MDVLNFEKKNHLLWKQNKVNKLNKKIIIQEFIKVNYLELKIFS